MALKIDWERQIGRRLRFRDLHVFFIVVDCGSMSKAAAELGVSVPTVSEVIADLEHSLGVKLLDRSPRGVEPTVYGQAFLKRGRHAFDELKQGIRDIEFLSEAATGELRIGCDESICAATLPLVLERFARQYPGVVVEIDDLPLRVFPPDLRAHGYDLVLTRLRGGTVADLQSHEDVDVEVLFNDELVIAAGAQSRWAGQREIDLADLAADRWILAGPETWNYAAVAEAFGARRLKMPKIFVKTLSLHIRANLLASGEYITALPRSVLHLYGQRFAMQILPVDLPPRPWPVILLTLKNRSLTPVVERFIWNLREIGQVSAAV
jgi:DNA-binding transcriptional LysR family regulator